MSSSTVSHREKLLVLAPEIQEGGGFHAERDIRYEGASKCEGDV